jgi:hypothetical protein
MLDRVAERIGRLIFPKQAATTNPARRVTPEIGSTGLRHQYGQIMEEANRKLRQGGWRVFEEMRENDSTVGAVMFAVEMLMRSVDWSVEPADTSTGQEDAEFLTSLVEDMNHTWADFISEVVWMLTYGFMPFEVTYKVRVGPEQKEGNRRSQFKDRKIGWRKFASRAPDTIERWQMEPDGGIAGIHQKDPNNQQLVLIPIDRLLLFRTTSHKNNPQGRSVLRNAYLPWYYKTQVEELEVIGIERDLVGYPVLYVPPAVYQNDDDLLTWKQIVRDVRRDEQEGLILPSGETPETKEGYRFELISSAGTKQYDVTKTVDRQNTSIAITTLMDWIWMGHQQVGTQSLAAEKVPVAQRALNGWMGSIAETINRHEVPRIFQYNGWVRNRYPSLRPGRVEAPNLEAIGSLLRTLSQAGAALFPNTDLQNWVLRAAGLPEQTDE